jgi:predicted ATP-binding protein involved in virulence
MPKASRKTKPKKDRSTEQETPAVYFRSIEVENVLCFKDKQVLNLSTPEGVPAQWTVILGDNGVGKTTLLRCLAGMELQEQMAFKLKDTSIGYEEVPLPYQPIIYTGANHIKYWCSNLFHFLTKSDGNRSKRVEFKTSIAAGNKLTDPIQNYADIPGNSKRYFEIKIQENERELSYPGTISDSYPSLENLRGLICYGYGAIRNLGDTSLSDSLKTENSSSLFSEGTSLINAEEWLLQTDYARKYAESEDVGDSQNSSQFNQIVDVLKNILPDVDEIRIRFTEDIPPHPRVEFKTPYGWVHINDLGLGYRTAIAWMVDLAVRMFRRYPNSADPLAEPAIVLVDEIDLHLHPRWQRTIMSFLSERFPNTQFIVTAHSPLVVQAAKDANIVLLRREGDRVIIDNNPTIIENWRVDQVLSSVFELDSDPHLDPLIKRRREILSQPHLSQADEKELKSLDAKIGPLPTATDPEDIKAMDIIRRAAHLLESI